MVCPPSRRDAAAGRKGYEIRRDDRDYQVGENLRRRKTLHAAEKCAPARR